MAHVTFADIQERYAIIAISEDLLQDRTQYRSDVIRDVKAK